MANLGSAYQRWTIPWTPNKLKRRTEERTTRSSRFLQGIEALYVGITRNHALPEVRSLLALLIGQDRIVAAPDLPTVLGSYSHQPSMSRLSGQATDIDIHAREILRMRPVINQLLADHSGQSLEKIEKDVERDFIMSPQ
jgi:hypothetical protein